MESHTCHVQAGKTYPLAVNGAYIFVAQAAGAFELKLDGNRSSISRAGRYYKPPGGFRSITLKDLSGSDQVIILDVMDANGETGDQGLILSGEVEVANNVGAMMPMKMVRMTGPAYNQVAINYAAATMICNYVNGARRDKTLIRNIGTVDIYLGNAGVTSLNGFLLRPLETKIHRSDSSSIYGRTVAVAGLVCTEDQWWHA